MMRQFEVVPNPSAITELVPIGLYLSQNRPNPFRTSTRVAFNLRVKSRVTLRVFDIAGREVCRLVDGIRTAGPHQATWDGRDQLGRPVPSGIYVARIEAGGSTESRKLALIR